MSEEKKPKSSVCLLCGKESPDDICDACKNKVQAEAFHRKQKQEKDEE